MTPLDFGLAVALLLALVALAIVTRYAQLEHRRRAQGQPPRLHRVQEGRDTSHQGREGPEGLHRCRQLKVAYRILDVKWPEEVSVKERS